MKKLKHKLTTPALLLSTFFLFSCSNSSKKTDMKIDISDNVINTITQGVGASIHAIEEPVLIVDGISWGGSVWGANPDPDDDERWAKVFHHIKWIGLDWTRLELCQKMYNKEEGVYSWDNHEMRILYKYLDFFQENNIDVLLQQMWSDVQWMAYPRHRNDPMGILRSAPFDKEKFAEAFATLLEHLIITKGYTCIKWTNFSNEPGESWSWWQSENDINVAEDITPTFAIVRKALDNKNINVPLLGPDWSYYYGLTADSFTAGEYVGGYDLHSYSAKFDWYKPEDTKHISSISGITPQLKEWVDKARKENKSMFLTEYGTMIYGTRGDLSHMVASKDAILNDAQLVIRLANLGFNGFNKWNFINRGDLDGQWQVIDTWDIKENKLLPVDQILPHENNYQSFALLSRFLPRNSKVLHSEVSGGNDGQYQRVFCAAVKTPSEGYTILLTNDDDKPYTFMINGLPSSNKYYSYTLENLNPVKITTKKGITIEPKQLMVISSYCLTKEMPGLISED